VYRLDIRPCIEVDGLPMVSMKLSASLFFESAWFERRSEEDQEKDRFELTKHQT
jgi:hypothetical protein